MSEPLDEEVVDGVPVLAQELPSKRMFATSESRSLAVAQNAPVQTAAVAAGSFLAGAALLGLVRRRHSRRVALGRARSPQRLGRARKHSKQPEIAIVGSRSLLVDVHLLGAPLRGR
ncbi:MAG: hypothetical protein WBV85_04760 [Solirubrobacteraceae bacterium]